MPQAAIWRLAAVHMTRDPKKQGEHYEKKVIAYRVHKISPFECEVVLPHDQSLLDNESSKTWHLLNHDIKDSDFCEMRDFKNIPWYTE